MAELFSPLTLRGCTLRNRIVMSPMVMYSAGEDGRVTEWHRVHYGARAVGGAGLILLEATAVEARGRISGNDLGLWDDAQVEPLAEVVRFCQQQGAAVGVQLAHAGRKAWSPQRGQGPAIPVGPSAIPFDQDWVIPRALSRAEIDEVVLSWRAAAQRAQRSGFDVIEIHGAHGYLLHEFLSPLSNRREDDYGGTLQNRGRLLLRVVDTVREVWPAEKPLFARLSATDWAEGGQMIEDTVQVARWLKEHGVGVVDCSSGGSVPTAPPRIGPGYQVPFAEQVRREAGVATMAVGLITRPEMAEEIILNRRADLVALGRALLRQPYWPLEAAHVLGQEIEWPGQYVRGRY